MYERLKEDVKNIILADPADIVDEKGLFHENAMWELVDARKNNDRRIGAANIYESYRLVREVCIKAKKAGLDEDVDELARATLKDIIIDLKEEMIVRLIPIRAREKIKIVIDNGDRHERKKREERKERDETA